MEHQFQKLYVLHTLFSFRFQVIASHFTGWQIYYLKLLGTIPILITISVVSFSSGFITFGR